VEQGHRLSCLRSFVISIFFILYTRILLRHDDRRAPHDPPQTEAIGAGSLRHLELITPRRAIISRRATVRAACERGPIGSFTSRWERNVKRQRRYAVGVNNRYC